MASKRETVCAAIAAAFAANSGAAYPPDTVQRLLIFDESYLDETKTTQYFMIPGKEKVRLKTNYESQSAMELSVIVASKYTATPQEFPAGESNQQRWQRENDLVADVVQLVSADPKFSNTAVGALEQGFDVEYGYLPKWALVEVRFTVDYRFPTGGR